MSPQMLTLVSRYLRLGCFALAAAVDWSWAAALFAAARAALPSGLPAEFPGAVADATVALQFRYNITVSVTAPNLSPLSQDAFSECVTMHLSFGNVSPVRVAMTPLSFASLSAEEASA